MIALASISFPSSKVITCSLIDLTSAFIISGLKELVWLASLSANSKPVISSKEG